MNGWEEFGLIFSIYHIKSEVNFLSEKRFFGSMTFSNPCLVNAPLKIKISFLVLESGIVRPFFWRQQGKKSNLSKNMRKNDAPPLLPQLRLLEIEFQVLAGQLPNTHKVSVFLSGLKLVLGAL